MTTVINEDKAETGSLIATLSFRFSVDIISLYKTLIQNKEFIISKQLFRSATSIGANVAEASAAISKKDFASKMSIASKEARETKYWLRLLKSGCLIEIDVEKELQSVEHIINILTKIVKTSQQCN